MADGAPGGAESPRGPDDPDEPGADTSGPVDTPDAVEASGGSAGRPAGQATGSPRLTALREQPPTDAPATFRGRVLHETRGAAAPLGFSPSVHFRGAVDTLVRGPVDHELIAALRGALAAAHRHSGVSSIDVDVDATLRLPGGQQGVRLTVTDDGVADDGEQGTTVTWYHALEGPGT